ncbi:MAG: type I restriction enzyme HsdR N-terminal domain-containing protein [Saprospiraceae bacterium]|nr:type I restriction enzyme HsdR N-terminal domain-containing protein [Saprospiraceae bacterium]MBK7812284.1 type I restriction enzyme HsdR N-terminal domain-containing protein [Saprospiraceae bacterium]MBK9632495.1 type I restriction enzyme HsdR N-terminal domain-containing protein [Saprospiraceae bacterium]
MNFIDLKLDLLKDRIQRKDDQFLFDPVRRKWIKFSSEEYVRQLMLIYLHDVLGYGYSTMAVERMIKLNGLSKRFDIVVFNRKGEAFILIECKSFNHQLSQDVWDQVSRYNCVLASSWLCITTGIQSLIVKIDFENSKISAENTLPVYSNNS